MTKIKLKQKQRGAVLVVSLLVLLVMTMIGLAAVQNTVLEEKMASNMHDKNLAFQAAEAALRAGERQLSGFNLARATSCEEGNDIPVSPTVDVICYDLATDPDPRAQATWDAAANYTEVDGGDYTQVGGQNYPRYYITALGRRGAGGLVNNNQNTLNTGNRGVFDFRVTARGTGGSVDAQSVLRSYFAILP